VCAGVGCLGGFAHAFPVCFFFVAGPFLPSSRSLIPHPPPPPPPGVCAFPFFVLGARRVHPITISKRETRVMPPLLFLIIRTNTRSHGAKIQAFALHQQTPHTRAHTAIIKKDALKTIPKRTTNNDATTAMPPHYNAKPFSHPFSHPVLAFSLSPCRPLLFLCACMVKNSERHPLCKS
jgi:hypothetical protein